MDQSETYEQEHVHSVYEEIASHFSSTRYKPWPIVERFLISQAPGSIGLDVGCGNGKYFVVNRDIFIVGSDRSTNLTTIASRHEPHTAIVADILLLPHPAGRFDFALSIAVIHHLSTQDRRVEAIASILATLNPRTTASDGGKALLYVWALEQKGSRRGWNEGDAQDVMVPWVRKADSNGGKGAEKTFQRYYHLYRRGELEDDVRSAGGIVVEAGYEKDNWWAVVERKLCDAASLPV